MTDIPPNSPIDLRALILYNIYLWKTTEKSYENYEKLCGAMGDEAISFEEYEKWFNKYLKESYYSARDGRDIPIPDIRGCILSDVICGKSAEKSIDDLCDAFKNYKIDKEDHDYWFKRFENGHLFSRVMFSDFPEDVVAEIVGKCDIKSNLNLRNVSFGLRAIVDQLAPPCTAIKVDCGETWIKVTVDDERIADSHFLDKANRNQPMESFERRIPESLTLLLRNPKLRLKYFEFYAYPGGYTKTVINHLNSLNRKIHVENCSIEVRSTEDLIGILQCFKPRTLEKIYLYEEFPHIDINQIVEMDQWKQAKHLRLDGSNLPPIEHLLHFSTIEARVYLIPQEDVVKLCKNLSKWTSYELIKLTICETSETEEENMKRALNLQPTGPPNVYSIPNSNMVILFEYEDW